MCTFSLLIFSCLKCPELIFAMFQFSPGFYFRDYFRNSIGSNFRACLQAHKYNQKFYMLACIHTKWTSLFSRVVIFAGGNFRIFSRRENYNSAKINVLKVSAKRKINDWNRPRSKLRNILMAGKNRQVGLAEVSC